MSHDAGPTLSPDINGVNSIRRSYMAQGAIEALSKSQVDKPSDTVVITREVGVDGAGRAVGESWIEAFDGDMAPDDTNPIAHPIKEIGNRRRGE